MYEICEIYASVPLTYITVHPEWQISSYRLGVCHWNKVFFIFQVTVYVRTNIITEYNN